MDLVEIKQALIIGIGIAVRQAVDTPPLYCTEICPGGDCEACGRMSISKEAKEEMANEIDKFFGRKGD